MNELALGNCDVSKVYKLEFTCNKNLKFLYSNDKNIFEVCIDNEVQDNLKYKSIPVG